MIGSLRVASLVILCALLIGVPSLWASWTWDGVAVCTATQNQQYPQLVSDGAGGAIITWQDYRGGYNDVYAQRVDASGAAPWAANGIALWTTQSSRLSPRIISDGAGGAIVAWQEYGGTSFYNIYAHDMAPFELPAPGISSMKKANPALRKFHWKRRSPADQPRIWL